MDYCPTDRYFFKHILSDSGLNHVTSTFWDGAQPLLGADQATIPHMKEDSQSFHMTPIAQIFLVK